MRALRGDRIEDVLRLIRFDDESVELPHPTLDGRYVSVSGTELLKMAAIVKHFVQAEAESRYLVPPPDEPIDEEAFYTEAEVVEEDEPETVGWSGALSEADELLLDRIGDEVFGAKRK